MNHRPNTDSWTSVPFIINDRFRKAGYRGVVHDHESGVRVLTSDIQDRGAALLSISFIPARYRVPGAPHPVKPDRATDAQVAMALLAFDAESLVEDNSDTKGAARMFWTSKVAS